MLIVVDKAREKIVKKLVAKEKNVAVITEDRFQAGDDLKAEIEALFKKAQIVKLTPEERAEFSKRALGSLYSMATGAYKGYNVLPALDVVIDQLRVPDRAPMAIEILGRLPGKENQYRLAGLATDPMHEKLRPFIAFELNRHLRENGVQLDPKQIAELKLAHAEAPEGTPARTELNKTMSIIARPTTARTGVDLFKFRPDAPAPAKEKEEKKDN